MFQRIGMLLAAQALAGSAGCISAMPITDAVTVDCAEWAQLDLFINFSRDQSELLTAHQLNRNRR